MNSIAAYDRMDASQEKYGFSWNRGFSAFLVNHYVSYVIGDMIAAMTILQLNTELLAMDFSL